MKTRLHQIAEILTGVTLREKPQMVILEAGAVLLMQLGDLDAEGNICEQSMTPVPQQKMYDKFVVEAGDIVFRGRGAGIVAAVMIETEIPVVAASPLIIVRPDKQKVDPHYLVWALTNDLARRYYAEHSRGSAIVGIGKRDLDQFEIDLPSLDIQKKIGQLKKLESREQHLLAQYQKTKRRLIEVMITDALHQENAV